MRLALAPGLLHQKVKVLRATCSLPCEFRAKDAPLGSRFLLKLTKIYRKLQGSFDRHTRQVISHYCTPWLATLAMLTPWGGHQDRKWHTNYLGIS